MSSKLNNIMNSITRTLYAILFLVIIGCNEKGNIRERFDDPEMKVLHIESPQKDSTIFLSSLVSDVAVLHLKYNEESTIGEIVKLKIHDEKIYIHDKYQSSIAVFSIDGRFINHIGRKGHGPREYIALSDFDINETTGHILIHDNFTRKIYKFLSDGTFVKEIQMPFAADQIAVWKDLIYMYRFNPSQYSNFSLNIYDTLGNPKGKYFESEPREIGILNSTAFGESSYDGKIPFQEVLYSNIYTLEKGHLLPAYKVDFGKNNLSDEAREKILKDPLSQDEIMNGTNHVVADVYNVYLLKDYLVFNYDYNRIPHTVFYHYETNRVINSSSIFDDVSYLYFEKPQTTYKDKLISVYYPHFIPANIDFIERAIATGKPASVSEQAKRNLEMLKKAKENINESNPYLIIYTLR